MAVVTGGSAGVGRATARLFAERGFRVGVLARGADGLDATVKEIEAAGGTALGVRTDVADHEQVESAAAQVERELGPVDVWVNNAMASVFAPFAEVRPEEMRRVTEVTYLGCVYGTMAALRRMRPRDQGTIVQVGSALAYRGIPLQSAYCGAKHAMQGFTESLRCELLHERSGVRVTMVQLPALNTPLADWVLSRLPRRPRPVPPMFQPEVAARAILWAAEHPRRREHWVGWPTVKTLVANAVAPGLLDRYLAKMGYDAQQTEEPAEDRPANLWEPVGGDHGAHGAFDDQARETSAQRWLAEHRGVVAAVGVAGLLAYPGLLRRMAQADRDVVA